MTFSFKKIQVIGLHFKIPWAHNSKKADTITGLVVGYKNRETYAEIDVDSDGKKRSLIKRGFHTHTELMNIMFSDEFAEDFGCIGDVADRNDPDPGKASNNQQFWERVQVAFCDKTSYGCLLFSRTTSYLQTVASTQAL